MVVEVVVAIAIVAGLFMLRHFAARRVAAGQGRFFWLMFLPALLGSGVIFWAAVAMFASAPILAAFVAFTGTIYLAVLVLFLLRLSRSVTASGRRTTSRSR